MEINILQRKIGLNFIENDLAEIWLWAPLVSGVEIVLRSSGKALQLDAREHGYWFLQTKNINPHDEYFFKLTPLPGQNTSNLVLERADPASLLLPEGPHKFSKAIDIKAFNWTDSHWTGLPLEQYIIYELHTGTFTPQGDFAAMESKLDYLLELGITAIELMPVCQFPGNRNWGYDGVYPFAVQNSYGGPSSLQQLINACHNKGISVILDVVYNHFGPEGNYLTDFGPYLTDKYHTPWGKALNFDDAYCDGVRTFFIENALMWFRDFHVDALRLDAVHAIRDFSPEHILSEIRSYTDQLSRCTGKPCNLIVELDLNDHRYINPQSEGGYGMDAQWVDEFHHALRVAAGQKKQGYFGDFNGVSDLAKSYNSVYVYDGQYSNHRHKKFGKPADGNPGRQFIVFAQNHDQVGNRMLGERSSQLVSYEMLKLMAGAVFCSPYIPLIFMGEEYAESNPFQFFISHSDQALIDAVRLGRKAEFADFHNEGQTPDPQSTRTFERSKLDWEKPAVSKHQLMFDYYQTLIALNKNNSVLANKDRFHSQATPFQEQKCLLLSRRQGEQKVICLLNFSQQRQRITLSSEPRTYQVHINSASSRWLGPDSETKKLSATTEINLAPESILILS